MLQPKKLETEEWPLLAERLSKHLPKSCKIYGTLKTCSNRMLPIEVWVDQWPNVTCGLTKLQLEGELYSCLLDVFRSEKTNLAQFLLTPGVIDWSKPIMIGAWRIEDEEELKDLGSRINSTVTNMDPADIYCLPTDIPDTMEVPAGMTLGSLKSEDADFVLEKWKYGNEVSAPLLRVHIDNLPSVCLLDENGKPAGFEMMMYNGSIGVLYVMPEFRKNGYARLITLTLARKIKEIGLIPYVFIEPDNGPSIRLHESVGFQKIPGHTVSWYRSIPNSKKCECSGVKNVKVCCI